MNKKIVLTAIPFLLLATSCDNVNYGYKYPESKHLPSGEHFVFWTEVENYIKEEIVPNYSDINYTDGAKSRFVTYSFDAKLDKRVPLKTLGDFFSRIENEGFERAFKDASKEKYYIASNWKSVKQAVKDEYSAKWKIENRSFKGNRETTRTINITVTTFYDDKFDEKDYGIKLRFYDYISSCNLG